MISALGAINGLMFTGVRLYSTFGRRERLFAWLSYRHRSFSVPPGALLVQTFFTLALVSLFEFGAEWKPWVADQFRRIDIELGKAFLQKPGGGFDDLVACTAPVFWLFFTLTGYALDCAARPGARYRATLPRAALSDPAAAVLCIEPVHALQKYGLCHYTRAGGIGRGRAIPAPGSAAVCLVRPADREYDNGSGLIESFAGEDNRMIRICATWLAAFIVLTAAGAGWAQDDEKATLRVYLPAADARLEIQGKVTTRTGTTRLFESPMLPHGKAYLYDVKATWTENGKPVVRERTVKVMAGQTTEVDMSVADKPPDPKAPDLKIPAVKVPEVKVPEVKVPDVKVPETKVPEVKVPEVKVPAVKSVEPTMPPVELRPPDVPFVVTPDEIVEEMLKLAKISGQDVVYDLGCGDGRIVITAVKKFQAKKGVGIDIDPARVKESTDNAKKEGVVGKVEFKLADLLKLTEKDLADATVVTLYLSPPINDKLAPLLKKLKPGTRIVSHDFGITDWPEDEKKDVVDKKNLDNSIYLWIVK